MAFQYTVGQIAMPQQFDRTAKMGFQPLGRHFGVGVVVQSLIDASDGLDILQHGTDVVTY